MGKVKKATGIKGSWSSNAKKGLSQLDPTTAKGRQNLFKGAVAYGIGGGTGVALMAAAEKQKRKKESAAKKAANKQTESEKAAGDIAIKEYNFAREMDFVKDEYANRVEQLGTQEMQDSVMGRANIDAQAGTAELANQVSGNLQAQGIDPSSGRSASAMTNLQSASGDAIGRTQSESAFALDSARLEGQNNRIAMAMGEKTKAVAGLQDIARGANQLSSQRAMNNYNSRAANRAAIGTAVGMAGQAYIGRDKGEG